MAQPRRRFGGLRLDGAAAKFHRAAKWDEGRWEIRGGDRIQCSGKKGETK